MAEEKRKPPKLPPKAGTPSKKPSAPKQTLGETKKGSASEKKAEDVPKKVAPKKLPPKSNTQIPSSTDAKPAPSGAAASKPKAKPKAKPAAAQGNAKQNKASQDSPSPASRKSSLAPKNADRSEETGSASPKPSTAQPSSSMPQDSAKQRPKPKPTKSNVLPPKADAKSGQPATRRPSLAPKNSSMQQDNRNKGLDSKSTLSDASLPKGNKDRPQPASRKPSSTTRKSPEQKAPDTPAHRISEENRDLRDILSESQCADLTILIANVTERMRQSIEQTFDANSGLKLMRKENKDEDSFASADFDPATVDVSAYDKERKLRSEQEKELSKPPVKNLKKATLQWFDDWRQVVIQRIGEVVNSKKTATDQTEKAATDNVKESQGPTQHRTQKISSTGKGGDYSPPKLEDLFPRVQTPLTKLPMAQRLLVIHSVFLLLLSLEHYNAASRVLLLYMTSSLKVGLKSLREDEEHTAQGLLEAAKQMTAEQETGKKKAESQESRKWKIRLASAAGAAIIGYTGGMAAPMVAAGVGSVMGELGLGATTAAGYLGTVAGNTAIVGSLFGAYGGRMTGQIMSNISAEVEDFAFLPVHGERKEHEETLDAATDKRRLRVIVAISGWLLEKEEVVSPWRVLKPSAEVFALRFELEALMNLGQSFDTMLSSAAYGYAQSALAQRTVFSELMSAMWPVALVKVARVVDNPFSLAKARADKAGEVLAEAIMNRAQGERPVTLIGYSLGARVIWSCLMALSKKRGFGFVESAVMIGSPIPSDINTWRSMRTAVTGRLVNVYSENDYLLAFLYRSASLQYGVAGLMPISGLAGIENVDVSEMVSGHLRYRYLVGSILDKIRFEDVDKDEVAKESKAFEAMVEEEKKNTYQKQFKENAGDLYDQYGERLGLPKEGRKLLPQKEKEISDDKANKDVSKMEKEVQQKTQKGLMQWAVEQLYISRPDVPSADDVKKAGSDPTAAAKKVGKTAQKTSDAATKSLYQRAMEATYLTRSGGPEGEAAAKGKLTESQSTGKDGAEGSYLSNAAGYIPSGYLPSFGATKKPSTQTPKKLGDTPKRPSTLGKTQSKSRQSASLSNKAKNSGDKAGKADNVGDQMTSKNDKGGKAVDGKGSDKDDDKSKSGSQTNVDTVGQKKRNTSQDPKKTADKASETAEGYGSYIPSLGLGKSNPQSANQTNDLPSNQGKDNPKAGDSTEKAKSDLQQKAFEQEKPSEGSGYGSYIPSFGFGSAAPKQDKEKKPSEKSKDTEDHDTDKSQEKQPGVETTGKTEPKGEGDKKTEKDTSSGAPGKGKKPEKEEPEEEPAKEEPSKKEPAKDESAKDDSAKEETAKEEPKKKYPWEVAMEREKADESSQQAHPSQQSGYTSYIPSFGWGGSPPKQETEQQDSEDRGTKKTDAENGKPQEGNDSGSKPGDAEAKSNPPKDEPAGQKSGEKEPTEGQKGGDTPADEPPKKKYPWETAMEEGKGVDPGEKKKAEQSSGYSSYVPSFGFGGSS